MTKRPAVHPILLAALFVARSTPAVLTGEGSCGHLYVMVGWKTPLGIVPLTRWHHG